MKTIIRSETVARKKKRSGTCFEGIKKMKKEGEEEITSQKGHKGGGRK